MTFFLSPNSAHDPQNCLRIVDVLYKTYMSGVSPRLGSHRSLVRIPLSTRFSAYFQILNHLFLFFDAKKLGFFRQYLGFFDKWALFSGKWSVFYGKSSKSLFLSLFSKKVRKKWDFPRNRKKNLPVFVSRFFFTIQVLPVLENTNLLPKDFYCNISFCDLHIKRKSENSNSFQFPWCCNSLFSRKTRLTIFI